VFNRPKFTDSKILAISRAKKGYFPPPSKNRGQWATWRSLRGMGIVEQRENGRYYLTKYGEEVYERLRRDRKLGRSEATSGHGLPGKIEGLPVRIGYHSNNPIEPLNSGMATDSDSQSASEIL